MFMLEKFSLIITTRCNLRCKLCCEYIPQNKPFPEITVEEAERVFAAAFDVCDRIVTLHLTGGEPFLHPKLPELINAAFKYKSKFDRLMLFTNSLVIIEPKVLDAIVRRKENIFIQLSQYGLNPEREVFVAKLLLENGIACKIEKYFGEKQSFGGWVDFGKWECYGRTRDEAIETYQSCAVTRQMRGNWRTRSGQVHWCSRSQRGVELGLIPDNADDYVDLFDEKTNRDEKRMKFQKIMHAKSLFACNYCSGDQGTTNVAKRFVAAEQV